MRAEYTVTTSEARASAIQHTSEKIVILQNEINMRLEQMERLERVKAGLEATLEQSQ